MLLAQMEYSGWNNLIAARFFNPEMAERRVYLSASQELINELGKGDGVGYADFIEAVKRGPEDVYVGGLCEKAQQLFRHWRRKHLPFPPYLGYLTFFVLAAGLKGSFAAHAYYPRLRKLLGEEPVTGMYPHFDHMRSLWEDLEKWSQVDQKGELGIFELRVTSGFKHVGVPISQVILSDRERSLLPAVFADAGLDPTAPPAEAHLAQVLRMHGKNRLRNRTIATLESSEQFSEEYAALIDTVLQELGAWDGTLGGTHTGQEMPTVVCGSLRLCCEEFDPIAGAIVFQLRCRTRHEFPADGLNLRIIKTTDLYHCDEHGNGWSTPLIGAKTLEPLDAGSLNFCSDLRMKEVDLNWRFALSDAPVRVFLSGLSDGLPGLVECNQLPRSIEFHLLARRDYIDLIERWGRSSCSDFRPVRINSGLPQGWFFYSAKSAEDDKEVRDICPVLCLPATVRVIVEGGVKARGSRFFDFALPQLFIEGAGSAIAVYCNGQILQRLENGRYALGSATPGTRLHIQVKANKSFVAERTLYVAEQVAWPSPDQFQWFDVFGRELQMSSSTDPQFAGALSANVDFPKFTDWILEDTDGLEESFHSVPGGVIDIVDAPPAADLLIGDLVLEWRNEVRAEANLGLTSRLASRAGGRDLTEGARHYAGGVRLRDTRSFNRAIGELTNAVALSSDNVIRIIGSAVLQLALYRSGRRERVSSVSIPEMPRDFARLRACMDGLARKCNDQLLEVDWPDGLGFKEISPVEEDGRLEDELRMLRRDISTEQTN
jgi:hypothetical protein